MPSEERCPALTDWPRVQRLKGFQRALDSATKTPPMTLGEELKDLNSSRTNHPQLPTPWYLRPPECRSTERSSWRPKTKKRLRSTHCVKSNPGACCRSVGRWLCGLTNIRAGRELRGFDCPYTRPSQLRASLSLRPPSQHGSALAAGGPAPVPQGEKLPAPSFKPSNFSEHREVINENEGKCRDQNM